MSESTVNIRPMKIEDASQVTEIDKALFEYPWSREDFERLINSSNHKGYVAEQDGMIVGYLFCSTPASLEREKKRNPGKADECEVTTIAVVKPYQNRGIGSLLLNQAEEYAASINRDVVVGIRSHNHHAQDFFETKGYSFVSAQEKFYKDHFLEEEHEVFEPRIIFSKGIVKKRST